jgi:hypothetical protein
VVRAAIPMYFDTEEKLMEAALYSLCSIPADKLRLAVIPNTLFLAECLVSEALVPELRNRPAITVSEKPEEFKFDSEGKITLRI